MNKRGGLMKSESLDGRENYTSIPIDDEGEEDSNNSLTNSLKKQMEEMPEISFECCIYRVPPSIRVLNEEVYTPQIVSIGPFHHNKKKLKRMEEHKLRCMKVFLDETTSLDDFITAIKGFEKKARNCYAETINLNIDEFVKILIIDSFFIFEVITESGSVDRRHDFCLPIPSCFFTTDIILLENQIPFFVLEVLFQLAFPQYPKNYFLTLSINYLCSTSMVVSKDSSKVIEKVDEYLNAGHEIKHFADLLRLCHLPSASRIPLASTSNGLIISIPNAVQLQEAGVQLLHSNECLLDINYTKGVLEIPILAVNDNFEHVMSNILALESCHYLSESYIGHYVFFMQMLVNTGKDANLLIQNGIIEGGSSTMVALFCKLRRGTWIQGPCYLDDTSNKLNTYCDDWHRWVAIFKRDYCSTPWRIASTTAAIILLILTFLSTIAAFLAL